MSERERQDDGDWVDRAARLARAVGLNPVRVRWKLENWRRRRTEAARRREQAVEHVGYQHKTCDVCGAVQDRDAATCTRCGAEMSRRGIQVLRRLGVFAPEWVSVSSALGVLFVAAFVRVVVASPGGMQAVLGADPGVLIAHGGHWPPSVAAGEYWRWLTACFLHAGLWHIGFNLMALAVVGPQVEALYGRLTMLFLFVVTGIGANIGSGLMGLSGVGIGASGGLMGLVGVAAGWGQREGTTAGRNVRNDMLKWTIYVVVFGFFIGADNWAHLYGFVLGAALGFAIRPATWKRRMLAPVKITASLAGVAATVLAVVLIVRPPASDPVASWHSPQAVDAAFTEMCRKRAAGDIDGAVAVLGQIYERLEEIGELEEGETATAVGVDTFCRDYIPPAR